eukprot:CAMPEP_0201514262 /NCGR_PEP_ID=MMETSP0161_2-20130828/6144_1 /ASSEMBLY_ACC=CAM_ASM_000251 /TAXON_ID=180227 /ORGANISM="Neoparamoeba aestuarina, Strain SoJaBio B1-5/56/2" /LENGTH=100 /DNA_ID=CAMNT_0047910769 /DNA_START=281 /DNA_END=580 /DNA_ORIENTATION=-
MYHHPLTDQHLQKIQEFGVKIIPSVAKKLACGDVGMGAMAEVETITSTLLAENQRRKQKTNGGGPGWKEEWGPTRWIGGSCPTLADPILSPPSKIVVLNA